jgi:hypothetical protein
VLQGNSSEAGRGVGEAELIGDEEEKVEELLLVRLVPETARGEVGSTGARGGQGGASSPGKSSRRRESQRDVV